MVRYYMNQEYNTPSEYLALLEKDLAETKANSDKYKTDREAAQRLLKNGLITNWLFDYVSLGIKYAEEHHGCNDTWRIEHDIAYCKKCLRGEAVWK